MIRMMTLPTCLSRLGARYSPSSSPRQLWRNDYHDGYENNNGAVDEDDDSNDGDNDDDFASWLVEARGTLLSLEFPQAVVT